MAARIAKRLVDEAIAKFGLSSALELRHDHRQEARVVVEEERFAEDFRPLRMILADFAECALAELLVADCCDGTRRHRSAEKRCGFDW